ncbi:MAG: oxidoreductase [Sporolactobacillus sp.]|jgi:putative YhdH/YhfP family quinone oxidoreductase|nr:oxidoreductase [Sporolactobacillus sp.]
MDQATNRSFQAFCVNHNGKTFSRRLITLTTDDLPDDDVLIRVHYSDINYKDGLAAVPNGKIVRSYPFIPGIDLAGDVVASCDPRFQQGDLVLATGYGIGVTHPGGFSEYACLPGEWLLPLPETMTPAEAMTYGTAGLTAALSVCRLEENGLTPASGKILVTGATGGVGSLTVAMLSRLGYHVVAATGKGTAHYYLQQLGAEEVVPRSLFDHKGKIKPLSHQEWAGAVDTVGGHVLASVLSRIRFHGVVIACGNAGGSDVPTSVFPFILRGISLFGIDSTYCPLEQRRTVWQRLAGDLSIRTHFDAIRKEIAFSELPNQLPLILNGSHIGRTVVKVH